MKTLLGLAAASLLASPGPAAAGEGEIVLLREVPPRIAYREAPPGPVISKANASPRDQVLGSLGEAGIGRELTDEEFAQVGVGKPVAGGNGPVGAVPATLGSAGIGGGGAGQAPGGVTGVLGGMNTLIGGAGGGAVGRATQDLGKNIGGMLGSLPAGATK